MASFVSTLFGNKPSPAEAAAQARAGQAGAQTQANAGAQNGTLSQYEGDITQSPMYKKLYGQGVQDTTTAYNQARTQRSARARMAGFGYSSPIAQTDSATTDQAEASDLGRVGSSTMQTLMPYQMQAAQMRGQNIGTYSGAQTSADKQWGDMETSRKAAQGAMWGKIAGLGLMGAGMIPGLSKNMSTGLTNMGQTAAG